jgi:hypothetical protein
MLSGYRIAGVGVYSLAGLFGFFLQWFSSIGRDEASFFRGHDVVKVGLNE